MSKRDSKKKSPPNRSTTMHAGHQPNRSTTRDAWHQNSYSKQKERKPAFRSMSGLEVKALQDEHDRAEHKDEDSLGYPGEYPFTRGPQASMYRGRLWTMRQFAGFGTPEDTNKRFHYLLGQGQTGLSTAFDMPTLMGYDPNHELSRGEVGREGVSVACIEDMESLFAGISLDTVSTSMTINCSAAPALAMYFALAKRQGIDLHSIAGTIQNDILKEYIAQKEWICPPEPGVRIVGDMIEYCSEHASKFHPVSISGYHIREAGATAVQELAFTLYNGITYVEHCLQRGMDIDSFAPRLSFFWDVHNEFFEEIAKFRAARRMWARLMKERFNSKDPRSQKLRTHAQTAGVSLTAQQPMNNVARVALQAMAAVLGGTQSLHTNSMDETLSLPTEEAVTVALRTQQIIAYETGVADTIDPLAGSYFVESLTDEMEEKAMEYITKLDDLGGMLAAIDEGFPQKEIAESAYTFQKDLESKEQVIVGVNSFVDSKDNADIPLHRSDPELESKRIEKFTAFIGRRSKENVQTQLAQIKRACEDGSNLMPILIEAVEKGITIGEVSDVYRDVFGVYRDPGLL